MEFLSFIYFIPRIASISFLLKVTLRFGPYLRAGGISGMQGLSEVHTHSLTSLRNLEGSRIESEVHCEGSHLKLQTI